MYAKLEITGTIELKTGMHIGGADQFSAIGAIDSPIVRDVVTNKSMIPGSSLKGKLRTLLAKMYTDGLLNVKHEDDHERITRLFGSSKKGNIRTSRLIFSDMILANTDELKDNGCEQTTEVKFENTINRLTSVANPRQIERAVKGSKYELNIIYDAVKEDEVIEDMETLAEGLKLLQYDYIGGSGSRGYGHVAINDISVSAVVGNIDDELVDRCVEVLSK